MFTLCRVTTEDGLSLDGALSAPEATFQQDRPALLLIHGTGSNFYGSGLLSTLAEHAEDDRYPVLRINTRGHDLLASIPSRQGSLKGGAAFEQVLDCHYDITAWCDFLVERNHRSIVLVGHSLGSVKAFWSQKLSRHPAVSGIIGVSPPRFIHHRFLSDKRCEPFRRDFAAAQQLVSDGKPTSLITVTQPLPMVITAQGFLDKYGPDDPLDYLPILEDVAVPKLILVGGDSVQNNPAFNGLPDDLAMIADADHRLLVELIPGADINYRNDPQEPWQRIRAWLER